MATTYPFALYNPSYSVPSGIEQYNNLLWGKTEGFSYADNFGGVKWWNGPDIELGYVIALPILSQDQPTPDNVNNGTVAFFRTDGLDDSKFITLTEQVSGYSATSASDAKFWLENNGYWTSYGVLGTLQMWLDSNFGSTLSSVWYDQSPNSNNGVINGSITTSKYNDYRIIQFTGGQYIQPGPFGTALNNGFTFDVWMNPSSAGNGTLISEWDSPSLSGWQDAQMALVGGLINIGVYSGGFIAGPSFYTNTWYNVVMTYDTSTLKLYIDGELYGTQSVSKSNPSTLHLTLGKDDNTSGAYLGGANGNFQGRLGVWRIYDYALGDSMIHNQYSTYREIFDDHLVVNLDASVSDSYNGSGSTWYDLSLKGNNGSISGASFTALNGGVFSFNGTNNFISIGQPLSTIPNPYYTISAWVYANSVTGSRNIVSSQNTPFWIANGTLYAGVGGNYYAVSSSSFPTGTWKYVTVTFNDFTNTMNLYINGSIVSTNSSVAQTFTSENMYIGAHYSGGTNVSFWDGYIAEVSIFNSEKSANSILDNFNRSKSRFGL